MGPNGWYISWEGNAQELFSIESSLSDPIIFQLIIKINEFDLDLWEGLSAGARKYTLPYLHQLMGYRVCQLHVVYYCKTMAME